MWWYSARRGVLLVISLRGSTLGVCFHLMGLASNLHDFGCW